MTGWMAETQAERAIARIGAGRRSPALSVMYVKECPRGT
jgi:hypothetical protein